jgi:hypothetical protein
VRGREYGYEDGLVVDEYDYEKHRELAPGASHLVYEVVRTRSGARRARMNA